MLITNEELYSLLLSLKFVFPHFINWTFSIKNKKGFIYKEFHCFCLKIYSTFFSRTITSLVTPTTQLWWKNVELQRFAVSELDYMRKKIMTCISSSAFLTTISCNSTVIYSKLLLTIASIPLLTAMISSNLTVNWICLLPLRLQQFAVNQQKIK